MTLIISIFVFFLFDKVHTTKRLSMSKLKVTTSFYPLAFLSERIGGKHVVVTNLTPAGVEPHDFEPNTRTIAELETQDIILLNGGGLEGYAEKLQANIDPAKTSIIFVGLPYMDALHDPHVWLDPILYKKEAEMITKIFVQKDPDHGVFYTENMQRIGKELDMLHEAFTQGLRDCKQQNIITSHNAFSYLARRYGLNQIVLAGISPHQEPSLKTLAEVATFAKTNEIYYIFFEELVSPVIAETIAQEVGAQTLVLNPLEGLTQEDSGRGKTYMSIQRENIRNLQIALACNPL